MNPTDYRREYTARCSALERERFDHHAGLKPEAYTERIGERYADLRTREAVEDLRRARDATPAQFETERAGLHALACAASLMFVEASAGEVTRELERCARSARVEWAGEKIEAAAVPDLIAKETDAKRRRDLAARRLDALRPCEDLRAARLTSFAEAARALGFESLSAFQEDLTGADLGRLSDGAEKFLERTADAYRRHLDRWAAHALPAGYAGKPEYADRLFFERARRFENLFPARDVLAAYAEAMRELGVRTETQANVRVDDAARPSKAWQPACFAVNPPDDVRLVVHNQQPGGANLYRAFFHAAGRAQHFAWVSRETAARYPEFVHAPDGATAEGASLLLSGLFQDAGWLAGHGVARATEASEVARSVALLELYEARRACARLRYWLALSAAADARSEHLDGLYAALEWEATGFRAGGASRWFDAGEAERASEQLRARLFAAGLREHLRARHGRRWHASRAAGEELVDIWNTASRHTVEELARLVWGGQLDFEQLAVELLTALDG